MRILYVGTFNRPFDTEVYVYQSLEALGHQVIKASFERSTVEKIEEVIDTVDFVLFAKGEFKKDGDRIWERIKASGKPTVGWFWDLLWGTGREWLVRKQPVFRCDIVFSTDGGHEAEWQRAGIHHQLLRQGIFKDEAVMLPQTEPVEDIVFVGSSAHSFHFGWKYRDDLLTWLQKTYGKRFGWYGKENDVRNLALNQLFANTKIVIGDSVASTLYWSNRLYESLGRGAFLIFPDISGIEFKPYREFVPYRFGDFAGLKEKIDYFLSHTKEREDIRKAGFQACLEHHTYEARCSELIKAVQNYEKEHKGILE